MKNNYLLLVTNDTSVSKLKEESNVTFLFPMNGFTVGFSKTFFLEEITVDHAFIFVNRIFNSKEIDAFKEFIRSLPKNIEGIVFDDIGVLQVLKTIPNHLTKILFLNHFNCNYKSINTYLEYVDSVLISTDITEEEVGEILHYPKNPHVLYTFGYVNIMFPRRYLITNYNEHFKKDVSSVSNLTNDLKQSFKIVENEYGTVIYTGEPFNGLSYRGKANVLYYFINSLFLSDEEIVEIIHSDTNLEKKYPYRYLSNKDTIVRIKKKNL